MAVILRNTGKSISSFESEKHSYYIVKHIDLPVRAAWERELVAQLCLHHSRSKLTPGEMPFKGKDRQPKQKAFVRLLALLQIIDALDPAHGKILHPDQVRIQSKCVQLRLSDDRWVELAKLRIHSKKAFFEKVFSRGLRAESL